MLCVLIRIASGDSYEYTQYTIFNIKKKITLNYPKSAALGFFSKGPKIDSKTAVVNEPSVFEPLKFYCTNGWCLSINRSQAMKFSTQSYSGILSSKRKQTITFFICFNVTLRYFRFRSVISIFAVL